jgi:L-2-hydroxyglutarate oxidase
VNRSTRPTAGLGSESADLIVVGAGIVGLATAHAFLERNPNKTALILEKESKVAAHQSGHNSGVLHSGIYYRPGSRKALNCRRGKALMEAFCRAEGIPFEICGKVVVATDASEEARLPALLDRARKNGVGCELIGRERLAELEPACAGRAGLHVNETGIVDYQSVCRRLAELVEAQGRARIVLDSMVRTIEPDGDGLVVESDGQRFESKALVNCAGLHSDRVTRLTGEDRDVRIVPFRGEYFELTPEAAPLCRNLIYPVPDPDFPFLGVHFTRDIHGAVECGPNAVFALAREGYRKSDFNIRDSIDALTYPGFLRLARRHWKTGLGEIWRSLSKQAFVTALQKLVPSIEKHDLVPAAAGVRAQAISRNGEMVDDFRVTRSGRVVHVQNAPSPAATSSLAIGLDIAQLVEGFDT